MAILTTRIKNRLQRDYLDIMDSLPGAPKDMSWKVRWRSRYDRNPMFVVIQDKYRVKEFAQARGVRSSELFHVTDKPETIPFDSLPANCFIKANHGCKWNILRKDGEFYHYDDGDDLIGRKNFNERKLDRQQVIDFCREWLQTTYSKREWAYSQIKPVIMVEELLEQYGGGELIDYRCFTFKGHVAAVYVDSATYSINHQKIFVDTEWNEFKLNIKEDVPHVLPPKPDNFSEIVSAAQRLAQDFDFIRVDLFNTTRGITLGEMSVYPMGGASLQPTMDRAFNMWLSSHWELPSPGRN